MLVWVAQHNLHYAESKVSSFLLKVIAHCDDNYIFQMLHVKTPDKHEEQKAFIFSLIIIICMLKRLREVRKCKSQHHCHFTPAYVSLVVHQGNCHCSPLYSTVNTTCSAALMSKNCIKKVVHNLKEQTNKLFLYKVYKFSLLPTALGNSELCNFKRHSSKFVWI